ncbi:MAG TPA: tRNA (guanosine(37)-N1)-methyltransferase TrmD [Burkholderiaceae bacterium]|nr:tRNA (guanosine(37)-N1)-methyltransferase TrmD [Burkholderiaceae bacterium]
MDVEVVTLFPEMVEHAARFGVTGRAIERGIWRLRCWNPRDFATDAYRRVDDRPFGGGPGMVMLPEPLSACLAAMHAARDAGTGDPGPDRAPGAEGRAGPRTRVVHLSPRGAPLTQRRVAELARLPALALLCGRYEGIDQRLLDAEVDEELSIGDFVVSGGELPALALVDAVVRLLPGVMTDDASALHDSFSDGLLEGPHYTRPEHFAGVPVPPVLMSGHHARITRWRREQALRATADRRPELIEQARREGRLSGEDEAFLRGLS